MAYVLTIAGLVIALVGSGIALYVGYSVVKAMRHRNTVDIYIKYQSDDFYIKITKCFEKEVKKAGGLIYKGVKGEIRKNITSYLNFHEMIAAGIHKGALDEELCKIYFESAIIRDYKDAKKYIDDLRKDKKDPELMCEFEKLYTAWTGNKKFQSRHKWFG